MYGLLLLTQLGGPGAADSPIMECGVTAHLQPYSIYLSLFSSESNGKFSSKENFSFPIDIPGDCLDQSRGRDCSDQSGMRELS